ncbi:hypothetical protein TGAM01_v202233 [Trichoderma gamsii]|uniref:Uncharacterized protein n=1 Tax=Trichoderma gamsii TaxID=398673 RepID=A0A2P4ZXU7_9HYPO|nr:hypothetical protein TGAM01_v202233 [Trichoderma gamsii]PON29125.1 hypothetical protein TGAM01_v202233 [Trichoderma gamsii]
MLAQVSDPIRPSFLNGDGLTGGLFALVMSHHGLAVPECARPAMVYYHDLLFSAIHVR